MNHTVLACAVLMVGQVDVARLNWTLPTSSVDSVNPLMCGQTWHDLIKLLLKDTGGAIKTITYLNILYMLEHLDTAGHFETV